MDWPHCPGAQGGRGRLGLPMPRPVTTVHCSVQLQITAEPRLGISQNGMLQFSEVRDDLENSLIPPVQRASLLPQASRGYFAGTCSSVVHVRGPVEPPG